MHGTYIDVFSVDRAAFHSCYAAVHAVFTQRIVIWVKRSDSVRSCDGLGSLPAAVAGRALVCIQEADVSENGEVEVVFRVISRVLRKIAGLDLHKSTIFGAFSGI